MAAVCGTWGRIVSLRTPLGRFLGLGSAHEGAGHWTVQRVTAVAVMPLAIWLIVSLTALPLADHAAIELWIGRGFNPVLLAALLLAVTWHSHLGLQVVIEDYVHGRYAKPLLLLVAGFAHTLLAMAGVLAIVRIAVRSIG
jgi:succinate dehydrogenase / fumarate reductase membrane anchor subunit